MCMYLLYIFAMIISNFLIKEKINALIKQFKETSFLLKKKKMFHDLSFDNLLNHLMSEWQLIGGA